MAANADQQQRTGNEQREDRSRAATATQPADRDAARNETRDASRSGRGDRERAIQTGRNADRSTGMTQRGQTSPVYGPGAARGTTPFALMRRMAEDLDRLFENVGLGSAGFGVSPLFDTGFDRDFWDAGATLQRPAWTPQVETFRRGDKIVVRADLPGLRREDVNVEIDNGMLTISGERREENEDEGDGYYRSERSYGQFYRALPLPEGVSEEQCEATFKDGVLEVTLPAPKPEERKAKQIPVR